MCHFLAPVGQPEMMHKNFMRRHLRISVVRCSGMKFFAHFHLNTPQIKPSVSLRNQRLFRLSSWARVAMIVSRNSPSLSIVQIFSSTK